jgi:hypothetical protein
MMFIPIETHDNTVVLLRLVKRNLGAVLPLSNDPKRGPDFARSSRVVPSAR